MNSAAASCMDSSSRSKQSRRRPHAAKLTRSRKKGTRAAKSARRAPDGNIRRASSRRSGSTSSRWSGQVTRHSDALDLEPAVFKSSSPGRIAQSLKRSAEASRRRKGTAFQSAMSMLNFYVNRGGANLSTHRKEVLSRVKHELRRAFGRE